MQGYPEKVVDGSVWTTDQLAQDRRWDVHLTAADRAELASAVAHVMRHHGGEPGFTKAEFSLPRMGARLSAIYQQLKHGFGFSVIRGLDMDAYDRPALGVLLWGLGCYLGQGIFQNKQGDLIGEVKDYGEVAVGDDPYLAGVRGYRTTVALPPHTDSCDLVGLMCLRAAQSGGASSIVSSTAIYNEIAATRPDLIAPLMQGFFIDLVGKGTADHQISFAAIPVFSFFAGKLSCRFNKQQIELGAEKSGQPLTPERQEAIDLVRCLSLDRRFNLPIDLAPGDIQLLNNRVTLHAREIFVDHTEIEQKRLMLRIWMNAPEIRPLEAAMIDQLNTGPHGQVLRRA
jgi:hypothetical protein